MRVVQTGWHPADDSTAAVVDPFETVCGLPTEDFRALAESIFIALPHQMEDGINGGIVDCVPQWAIAGSMLARCLDPHGGFIEVIRAGIVRRFLDACDSNPKLKFCVMMDSDESCHWSAPYKLAIWDRPVVSAVVCSWNDKRGIYACFTIKDKNGIGRFPSVNFTQRMPRAGLIKADRVGTGLVCIRKDVLQAIDQSGDIPFYIPEQIRRDGAKSGSIKQGEDMVFSAQCERLGFDRFVDLSVHAKHYKTLPLTWPLVNIDPALNVEDWDVSEHDFTY